MLSNKLLAELDLLPKHSLLVFAIGVIVVSINRIGPQPNISPLSILSPNLQTLLNLLKPLLSELHLPLEPSSLSPDHPLLIFLSHVLLVGDALIQLVP